MEVGRQLADNRVGKLQIKADQMRLTVESIRNRIELKFEEVAEVVEEMKRDVLRKFDSRWEEVFKGVEESAKELESRIERYEEALTEITRIRTKSSKANEELIAFLFGNQTEVEELNEQGKEAKEDHYVEAFDSLSTQINLRLTRSMEVSQMSVFSPLRDYFNDILILNQPKVNPVTRNSKDKSKSPSAKRSTPDKPTVEDSKRPKEIMKEIKSKLEQYKRTRKESSDDQEDDRAWQPTYSKQPKQEYNTIPRNYRSGILASREGLNRRNPSEDSYNDQESNDRYDHGNIINTDRNSDYHHTVQDRQLPRYENPSQYYSSKVKDGRKNSFKNYQAYEPYKRDFAKPELGLRSKLFHPDTKHQRGVQSVKHGGYSSSFVGDETAQNRNSNWYFESMKTINDLKNFRDNVRSKLSVATPFSRHPQSKQSTPRYGIH